MSDNPSSVPAGPPAPRPRRLALARLRRELGEWLGTLTSAAVYVTLIVTFVGQIARVDGHSMAPSLENQDRLIVNKLAYELHDPAIGDIVMLYFPRDPRQTFVKRVVAGPGDAIRSVNGHLYRNDVLIPDDFIPEAFRSHDNWVACSGNVVPGCLPDTIGDGYYFVMGDHRNGSSDSREWGLVPMKYIVGKVQLRWWPLDRARVF